MRSRRYRLPYRGLLFLAGLLSFCDFLVGLLGMDWGGAKLYPIVTFGAMFGTPLSLFLWKKQPRTALRISGVCSLIVWAGISWHNYKLCDTGPCITHDPYLVVLTSLMVAPVLLCLLSWACLYAAWRVRLVRRRRLPRKGI
jgi:hypothetical protein